MGNPTVQDIGIIFSIFLGIVSMAFGILQARHSANQMKSATSETMFGHLMQLNQLCLDNAEDEYKHLGGDEYGAKTIGERRAQILIDLHLTFLEEAYNQHRNFDAYTPEQWAIWAKMLESMGRSSFVREYWVVFKTSLDPSFVKVVDLEFAKAQPNLALQPPRAGAENPHSARG